MLRLYYGTGIYIVYCITECHTSRYSEMSCCGFRTCLRTQSTTRLGHSEGAPGEYLGTPLNLPRNLRDLHVVLNGDLKVCTPADVR